MLYNFRQIIEKEPKRKKMPMKKVCPKCLEVKHYRMFYKNKRRRDGLCDYCKSCDRLRMQINWRKKHPQKCSTKEYVLFYEI